MNILLAFNSGYFIPARVLIHSVLLNNSCQVAFFIMHTSLTQEEMAILLADAQVSGHCSIHFVPVPETAFADAPLHLKWISKETYYRLLAQELLPEWVDRILYLDADMVVLRSLEEFYHSDFEGELLVACSTYTEKSISPSLAERFRQLTLPPDTLYFNAGVLLYDLAAQRKAIDPSIYHEYPVWFYQQLKYQDQDVLNAVFYRQVKLVSWRLYNAFEYSCEQEALGSWVDNNSVIFHLTAAESPGPKSTGANTVIYSGNTLWISRNIRHSKRIFSPNRPLIKKSGLRSRKKKQQKNRRNQKMKVKDGFILRKVGVQHIVVAAGEAGKGFNGMIRINEVGALLFGLLMKGTTMDEMVDTLCQNYEVSKDQAKADAERFVNRLKEANLMKEA